MNNLDLAKKQYTCDCWSTKAETVYHAVEYLIKHIEVLEERIKVLNNGIKQERLN